MFHIRGLWPQLRKYVTIITATTAVGPTHAVTICFAVRSTSLMGDLQGGQDRATSAFTRSKGLLLMVYPPMPDGLIANLIVLAHACGSSMRIRDYWRMPSLWSTYVNGASCAVHASPSITLPPWDKQIDLQSTPRVCEAHVIAQKYGEAVILFFREITSHSWRDHG